MRNADFGMLRNPEELVILSEAKDLAGFYSHCSGRCSTIEA
jgi:hypothetical protein